MIKLKKYKIQRMNPKNFKKKIWIKFKKIIFQIKNLINKNY